MDFPFKSFLNLLNYKAFNKIIGIEIAHTKPEETLDEHSKRTYKAYIILLKKFGLESIILNLVKDITSNKKLQEITYLIISMIVFFHDVGKINPKFQEMIKNDGKKNDLTHHSSYGFFIFYYKILCPIYNKKVLPFINPYNINEILEYYQYLATIIWRHHTRLLSLKILEKGTTIIEEATTREEKQFNIYKDNCKDLGINKDSSLYNKLILEEGYNLQEDYEIKYSYNFFYLYKLIYSLTITADRFASSHREKVVQIFNEIRTFDYSKIDDYLYNIKKIIENKKNINNKFNDHRNLFKNLAEIKLEENIEDKNKRVFYLYLPTGGGKTLLSLSLALKLIKKRKLRRLYYVFPFINLIEQNSEVIRKVFRNKEDVIELHSYLNPENILKDDKNENNLNEDIDLSIFYSGVVVTSNVNFFNTFIKNSKHNNYKILALVNSVVVIDEIQTLNDEEWLLYASFIHDSSKYYNINYIIMSATVPRLSKLYNNISIEERGDKKENSNKQNFVNLIDEKDENIKDSFKDFYNRVEISYREDLEVDNYDDICNLIKENKSNKCLIVVNTVNSSIKLYNKIKEKLAEEDFGEIILLNSTILNFRRRKIIKEINKVNKKCILISTQSIEAGLDISFNFGIREYSPLESILQVAGRINRNGEVKSAKLIIIHSEIKTYNAVYNDIRGNFSRQQSEWYDVLKKEFSIENKSKLDLGVFYQDYFEKVSEKIIKEIKKPYTKDQSDSLDYIKKLKFEELNKKDVIKDKYSLSFFVPINNIELLEEKEALDYGSYLKKLGIPYIKNNLLIKYDWCDLIKKYFETEKKGNNRIYLNYLISNHLFSLNLNKNKKDEFLKILEFNLDEKNEISSKCINELSLYKKKLEELPFFILKPYIIDIIKRDQDSILYCVETGFNKPKFTEKFLL